MTMDYLPDICSQTMAMLPQQQHQPRADMLEAGVSLCTRQGKAGAHRAALK